MGILEEQILKRIECDDAMFRESMEEVSSSVTGKILHTFISGDNNYKNVINEILYALHIKPNGEKIVDASNLDEKYEDILRSHGIMSRHIKLRKGWYKDAIGPILAVYKNDPNIAVALIPGKLSGYTFLDLKSGKKKKVDAKNEVLFEENAICFYKPMPLRALKIKDLILFALEQYNIVDVMLFLMMLAMTTAVGMLVPKFNQWLFGVVFDTKEVVLLVALSCFIFSYIISKTLINVFSQILNFKMLAKQKLIVEAAVMSRVVSLPATFFSKYTPGDLASRLPYVSMVCDTLLSGIGVSMLTSIFSMAYFVQIFSFAPSLTTTAFVVILCTFIISLITTFMQQKITERVLKIQSKTSGKTYAIIKGIQKIKLAAAEKRFFSLWAGDYAKQAKDLYNPPLFLKLGTTINMAISLVGTALIYYFGFKANIAVANYVAFNSAFGIVRGAFLSLVGVGMTVARIKPMLTMIQPIMESVPEISEKKEMIDNINGNIELSNVSFRYSDDQPLVINELSLKIDSGEYVAIVGKTGCGKSTLLRLLLGFEAPQKGAIYYDGKDFEHIDKQSLRRKMGTVMQNDKLFLGDIFSNITISAPNASMDEAWEAATIASIDEDIKKMPMGMQTLISEGQGGISGGQRQRLMIARAVVNKPKIMIFDEATSALDNVTQKKVSDAISGLQCTRIVVAHRLSTIKNADRILYLENGKIIEEGKYDELIKKNGHFAELVRRQMVDGQGY